MEREYFVRTQFDGNDYLKVFEVYYFDENGEDIVDEHATAVCDHGITCADLGEEALESIQLQVEKALDRANVKFLRVTVEPPEE